jgi:hypothetical protein
MMNRSCRTRLNAGMASRHNGSREAGTARWLGVRGVRIAASAFLAVFVLVVALEHVLEPALAPLRHEISEYSNTPDGWLMESGFVAWALSLSLTSAYVYRRAPADPWRVLLCVVLGLGAAGLVLTAIFHTETSAGVLPRGVRLSTEGRLHDWGSGTTSLALFAGALVCMRLPGLPQRVRNLSVLLVATAVIADLALLAVGPSVGGLRQRVLIGIGCLWQTMLLYDA